MNVESLIRGANQGTVRDHILPQQAGWAQPKGTKAPVQLPLLYFTGAICMFSSLLICPKGGHPCAVPSSAETEFPLTSAKSCCSRVATPLRPLVPFFTGLAGGLPRGGVRANPGRRPEAAVCLAAPRVEADVSSWAVVEVQATHSVSILLLDPSCQSMGQPDGKMGGV